jgi:lysophospholipase L1-like esterase
MNLPAMTENTEHKKIVFIGDSITACAKNAYNHGPLGCGYVSLLTDLLMIRKPKSNYSIINSGIDGNTIGHLLSRWADDVYVHQPDMLFMLIGINDAVRFIEKSSSCHLPPKEFAETYTRLIADTQAKFSQTEIILIEPFYLTTGVNPSGSYRNDLAVLVDQYIDMTREVAAKLQVKLCQTNLSFRQILKHKPAYVLSDDCIHLTRAGHMVLAEEIFSLSFNGGTTCSI